MCHRAPLTVLISKHVSGAACESVSGTEISKFLCIPKHHRLLTSSLVGCLLAVGVATSTAAAFGSLLWILLSSPNRPTPQLHKHQQRTGEVNSYSSMASVSCPVSCCSEPRSYGLHLDGIWLVTGTAPQPPPRGLAVTSEARSCLPPCGASERNRKSKFARER